MFNSTPGMGIKNLLRLFCIGALSLFLLTACNKSAAPSTVNGTETAKNSPAEKKETSTPAEAPSEIAGKYKVTGRNPGGGEQYNGDLSITKRGQVYQFTWNAGETYEGVGVRTENTVAAAFTTGQDGKGCRVVHYKIGSDGTLDGKWGEWGINDSGTEKAARSGGNGIEGDYETSGTNLDGAAYKGKLKISVKGAGFGFSWDNKDTGFGIRNGDFISVGIGGKQCGFVTYKINPDGSLDGKWGSPGASDTGTETATKN